MEMRVLRRHQAPLRKPLRLTVGDRVTVGDRSPEWPAFVFVSSANGDGWVPERHLTADRPGAVAVTSYDTTELPVDEDEIVTVVDRDDESGWWWCQSESGARGWIPVEAFGIDN